MTEKKSNWFASRWALAPAALLLFSLAGLTVMASIAAHDASFATEPDYYRKAANWDRERAQRAENARLGYQVTVRAEPSTAGEQTLTATLTDSSGGPLAGADVSVTAFHNARAASIQEGTLREVTPGVYSTTLRVAKFGLWELRFVVRRGNRTFTSTSRVELAPGGRS